eukprot:Skav227446  [mRNA]  locus=scaffold2491:79577:88147:+ [translate_table: standard]
MPKIREARVGQWASCEGCAQECENILNQTKKRLEDMARQKAAEEERKVAAAEEAVGNSRAKMLTEKSEALSTVEGILEMSEEDIEQQNKIIQEAKKAMERITAKFKSFDVNRDGFLDKKEIIAYSKKDRRAMEVGTKGVSESDFQRLKVRIGCLRERLIDEARRKKRQEREVELEGLKDAFKNQLEKCQASCPSVEDAVKKVEDCIGEIKVGAANG